MSNLIFAPGETNISEAQFTQSLLLFWLKTDMAVTSRRFVARQPNTLVGLIPLGYQDVAFPLPNVASAGVSVKFSLARSILGALFVIGGLSALNQNAAAGLVIFFIGLSLLANAASATLILTNSGGGVSALRVSLLEKAKLESFRNEVNSRLFIDAESLRHNEVMSAHQISVLLQQQQLQALQNQSPGQPSSPPGRRPLQQGQPWQSLEGQPSQPWPPQPGQPWQAAPGQPWQPGQPGQAPQGQAWPSGQPWQAPQDQPGQRWQSPNE